MFQKLFFVLFCSTLSLQAHQQIDADFARLFSLNDGSCENVVAVPLEIGAVFRIKLPLAQRFSQWFIYLSPKKKAKVLDTYLGKIIFDAILTSYINSDSYADVLISYVDLAYPSSGLTAFRRSPEHRLIALCQKDFALAHYALAELLLRHQGPEYRTAAFKNFSKAASLGSQKAAAQIAKEAYGFLCGALCMHDCPFEKELFDTLIWINKAGIETAQSTALKVLHLATTDARLDAYQDILVALARSCNETVTSAKGLKIVGSFYKKWNLPQTLKSESKSEVEKNKN